MNATYDLGKARKEMRARKILVKDLALKIGLTPNTLSSALNGNRMLGKAALISLFRELGLEPESFKKKAS